MRCHGLLAVAVADLPAIVRAVAHDVAGPDDDPAAVEAEIRPAFERLLSLLEKGSEPSPKALAALRTEGAQAARHGVSVERVIDRYLSSAWVLWTAAAPLATEPTALSELGAALLRIGDLAAAAIAEGHGSTERELAGREAAARRELLDELLAGPAGDDAAIARAMRQATLLGLPPDASYRVVVAQLHEPGEAPDAERVARALARPSRRRPMVLPLAGARHDRLVLVAPEGHDDTAILAALSAGLSGVWFTASSGPVAGLASVGEAYARAVSALRAVVLLDWPGRLISADDVLVERVLLNDEQLLAAAIEHALGPLDAAARGGPALLATLRMWLASGQNAHATARALGVAPRTVAYRLERIARLLGRPLDGEQVLRLGTAILGRRLLAGGTLPRSSDDSRPPPLAIQRRPPGSGATVRT